MVGKGPPLRRLLRRTYRQQRPFTSGSGPRRSWRRFCGVGQEGIDLRERESLGTMDTGCNLMADTFPGNRSFMRMREFACGEEDKSRDLVRAVGNTLKSGHTTADIARGSRRLTGPEKRSLCRLGWGGFSLGAFERRIAVCDTW